jgi:hypothetical protein
MKIFYEKNSKNTAVRSTIFSDNDEAYQLIDLKIFFNLF